MTKKKSANTTSDLAWQPAQIRMTAFFKQRDLPTQNWWEEVVGTRSENRSFQQKNLEHTEDGSLLGGKLVLAVNPIRVDWRLIVSTETTANYQFAALGSFDKNIEAFSDLVTKWFQIQSIPAISRLAFGTTLLQPVDSLSKGYGVLKPLLHFVELDIENSSDLLYQINRPRPSKTSTPNLAINRLSKWAVLRLNVRLFSDVIPATIEVPEAFAAHIELDINTSKDFEGQLPPAKLPSIFGELVSLGREIAAQGDIK